MWLDETLHPGIRQSLRADNILHREQTDHQDLVIFENPDFGRVMMLDGVVQTTEADEYIYHEMLAHPPVLAQVAAKGACENVLIVGGGDGGCLREVLRHARLRATMVEIDQGVIDLCRQHLPNHSAGAFDDARATIVISDGAKFVAKIDERFDVIIIDSTDPIGPGAALFTEQFYRDCKRCLTAGGVLVTQNGVPFLQGDELAAGYRKFKKLFRDGAFYVMPVPTYNGGFMALGWATDNAELRQTPVAEIASAYNEASLTTRYFNPEIFAAAFALPNDIKRLMHSGC